MNLYKTIIVAGTHLAPSIKVAEAAKVIENSQRDINIAFVNELAKIFSRSGHRYTRSAGSSRHKMELSYLSHRAWWVDIVLVLILTTWHKKPRKVGYNPEIILAGRRMNDGMGAWVASKL